MRIRNILAAAVLMAACGAAAWGAGPEGGPEKVKPVIALEARPFAYGEVTLLDGPFKHAEDLGQKYLTDLEVERLLAPYYESAGEKAKEPRYGGWESALNFVPGHILGHWLSATSRMSAVTGDAELKNRMDQAVSELATLQDKYGDGYISGFPEKSFLDVFAGHFDAANNGLAGQAVPWYTMHKIYAGLIDAYEIGGNQQALTVVKKLADWAKKGTDKLSDAQFQNMLLIEHGGMSESMAELYSITGDKKYLDLAVRFTHHQIEDPLAAGKDDLSGVHANTQIPKIVGASRVFELTGQNYFRNVATYFWDEVVSKRTYVFGGNSLDEHFQALGKEPLGPTTAETCNTYNMLRLTKSLMMWHEDSRLADYYERALYNHILASQDPQTGMMTYFLSTKPGHFKVYSTPYDSMWCCTGTGMENPARYTDAIYYHNADTVWVNLYIASQLEWKSKGLTLRQETAFPEAQTTKLTFDEAPASEVSVKLRVPSWAAGEVVAKVNGKEAARGRPGAGGGGWLTVKRKWVKNDVLELALPMALHLYHAEDDAGRVAIMYGPIVLAGALGTEKMPASDQVNDQNADNSYPVPITVPVLVTDKQDPATWVKPVEGKPLTFKTQGVGKPEEVSLIPFYALHHQRYTVYFDTMTAVAYAQKQKDLEKAQAAARELDQRTIDQINTGEQQPDTDHQMKGDKTRNGAYLDKSWRDAEDGGWFSYEVKVAPDAANVLRVTYWGSDNGNRNFEILVDGKKVAEQTLNNNKPDSFFDVEYPIPNDQTHGKQRVEVKFQGMPGNLAGGVFGVRVLRK